MTIALTNSAITDKVAGIAVTLPNPPVLNNKNVIGGGAPALTGPSLVDGFNIDDSGHDAPN
jgi:hypothetical protein